MNYILCYSKLLILKNIDMILVTNYKTGLRSEPLHNVMPDKRIVFDKNAMTLEINESLIVSVFETLPHMRNIPANKSWFESNIYHLR